MAKILSGLPVGEKIKTEITQRLSALGRRPVLAIVQVGDREDSNVYIKNKIKFGEEIGVETMHLKMEGWEDGKIENQIQKLNQDEEVDGIIVQLPLPEGVDAEKVLKLVSKEKDPEPATARAVLEILDYYNIGVAGKKACVIGQGLLAGKAIGEKLRNLGALVASCDIHTKNIPEIAKGSDILISAVGKAGLITKEYVNNEQVVIDVGFDRDANGKLAGDVVFEEVEPLVAAITPVPGGVGPVTVASLFANLLDLVYNKQG
jgi:methylenetetrahydrofolate dehydrogenase (NADP+)/methenyltetrahydrofolate cyclohydrolase